LTATNSSLPISRLVRPAAAEDGDHVPQRVRIDPALSEQASVGEQLACGAHYVLTGAAVPAPDQQRLARECALGGGREVGSAGDDVRDTAVRVGCVRGTEHRRGQVAGLELDG